MHGNPCSTKLINYLDGVREPYIFGAENKENAVSHQKHADSPMSSPWIGLIKAAERGMMHLDRRDLTVQQAAQPSRWIGGDN